MGSLTNILSNHIKSSTGVDSIGETFHSSFMVRKPLNDYHWNSLVMIHKRIELILLNKTPSFNMQATEKIWLYYQKLNNHLGHEKIIKKPINLD